MSYIECVDGTKYFPKHQDERIGRLELLARWIDEHGGRRPKTLDDIADVSYMPAKMRETNPYSYWGSIEEAAKKAGEYKLTGDNNKKYEKREGIADSLVKESVDNHYSDTELSWINERSVAALGISLEDVKFFFGDIEQLKTKVKSGVIPIRNKRRLKEKNRLKFESSHQGIASITIPDEIIKKLPKESPSSEGAPKPESEETSKAEPKKVSNPESEEKPQEMPKESNDDASQEDETSTLIREENTEFNVDDITGYVEYEVDEDLDEIVAEAEEAEAVVDEPEPESEPEETKEPEPEPESEPEETKEPEPEPEPEDSKELEPTPEPKKPTHYGPKPPKVELFANYIEYAKQNARVIAQTELRQLQKEYPGKYPNWDQLQKAGFISYYLDLILNLPFNEPRQRTRVESQRAEDLKKGTIPRIADINKILSTDRSKTYDVDEMTMDICWFEGKDLSAVGGEKTTTIKEVIEIKKGASKNVKKEVTPMKEESRTVNKQPEQVIVTNSTPIVSNPEANNTGVMVLNGVVKMVTYDVVTHTQITLPEGVEGITLTFPVTVTIKK